MKTVSVDGVRTVEVDDLSFLYDRRHFTWIGREVRHFRLSHALRHADRVVAANVAAASDVHKYYRFPLEKITVKEI